MKRIPTQTYDMPLFSLTFAESSGSASAFSSILSMLLDIIPRNIFSPFVEGNTLQIIFLGIVIGISLLFLGRRTNAVAVAVEQINYLVQFLIEFISRLVPSFIFIVLVRMIWSDSLSSLSGVGKFFAVFLGSALAIALACDTFLDFVTTGGDQFLLPLPLLTEAGKLGMLDHGTLRDKTS